MPMTKVLTNIMLLRLLSVLLFALMVMIGSYRANMSDNPIDYSLDALFPKYDNELADFNYFKDKIAKQFVFLVISDEEEKATNLIISLEEMLDSIQGIRPDIYIDTDELRDFYFKYRYVFANHPYVCDGCSKNQKNVKGFKDYILNAIYSPFGGYTSHEIQEDPFLTMRSIIGSDFKRFKLTKLGIPYVEYENRNIYIAYGVIEKDLSVEELNQLYTATLELQQLAHTNMMNLIFTGEPYYVQAVRSDIMLDMENIGLISVIVIVLTMLLLYRGLLPLVYTTLTLGIALISGIMAVVALYGNIHVLTIAIGGCLISICTNYCIYIYTLVKPSRNAKDIRSLLVKPLSISLIISIIAFVILGITDLAVLESLAVFVSVAFIMTYAFVMLFLSSILSSNVPSTTLAKTLFSVLMRIPKALIYIIIIGFVVCSVTAIYLKNGSSHKEQITKAVNVQNLNPQFKAMTASVHELLAGYQNIAYYVIEGKDLDDALTNCYDIYSSLTVKERVNSFFPCKIVPPKARQITKIKEFKEMYPILEEIFAQNNLSIAERAKPLSVRPFTYEEFPKDLSLFFGQNSVLVQINADNGKLLRILEESKYATRMDYRSYLHKVYEKYNRIMVYSLLITLILVVIALIPLMKKQVISLVILPSLVGALSATLGFMYFTPIMFNMFVTLGFFMLFALGINYCIFIYYINKDNIIDILQGTTVACLIIISSFGAMMLSYSAMMLSFGVVVFFGLIGMLLTALMLRVSYKKEEFNDIS